jgi:Helix-turn-helix domain
VAQNVSRAVGQASASAPSRQECSDSAVLAVAVTVRQKKNISLEQIAEQTKIGVRSLRAIENGDFGKLPGGIYNTSYIKQYARAIEFDEQELLALYYKVTGITPPAAPGPSGAGSGRPAALGSLRQPSTAVGS